MFTVAAPDVQFVPAEQRVWSVTTIVQIPPYPLPGRGTLITTKPPLTVRVYPVGGVPLVGSQHPLKLPVDVGAALTRATDGLPFGTPPEIGNLSEQFVKMSTQVRRSPATEMCWY